MSSKNPFLTIVHKNDLDEHAEVHHQTQPAPPHPVDAKELLVDQPAQGPVLEHDQEGLGAPENMTWGHVLMMRTMVLIMGRLSTQFCPCLCTRTMATMSACLWPVGGISFSYCIMSS